MSPVSLRVSLTEYPPFLSHYGRIQYLSGPLVKVSSMVKKVDLHKRIVEVETDFMGEKHVLYLGMSKPDRIPSIPVSLPPLTCTTHHIRLPHLTLPDLQLS